MTEFEVFMFLTGTCFGAAIATVYAVAKADAKALTDLSPVGDKDKTTPRVHTQTWGI